MPVPYRLETKDEDSVASFDKEISQLDQTYSWARQLDIAPLRAFVELALERPLVAVGSGGSLTAAATLAMLHEAAGHVATATTPLQVRYKAAFLRNASVLLVSAGGGNPDALECARYITACEPHQAAVLCMRRESRLEQLSSRLPHMTTIAFGLPRGKDGFLATNSLFAIIAVLIRAYNEVLGHPWKEPRRFAAPRANLPEVLRPTIVALHAGWSSPAALDLESKFIEAAIANVQLADYRHFAHGRHNWLAKNQESTLVVTLSAPDMVDLARKTIALFPSQIPTIPLTSDLAGPWATLDLLRQAMLLTADYARQRGLDPARPRVPKFGRKLYHLSTRSLLPRLPQVQQFSVMRKTNGPTRPDEVMVWRKHYEQFLHALVRARFGSIVLDYDGTCCDPSKRFLPLDLDVANQLVRILTAGITIGIATGRGKSVREALRGTLPQRVWPRVMVGYYYASIIAPLSEAPPPRPAMLHPQLVPVLAAIRNQSVILRHTTIEERGVQLTLLPKDCSLPRLWQCVQDILTDLALPGVVAFVSDHSLDVLAPEVSKRHLVHVCQKRALARHSPPACLCIGDMGGWPGNDAQLLSEPYSLSVAHVSARNDTCWNLLPPGCTGTAGVLHYLKNVRCTLGKASFSKTGAYHARSTC